MGSTQILSAEDFIDNIVTLKKKIKTKFFESQERGIEEDKVADKSPRRRELYKDEGLELEDIEEGRKIRR